MNMIQKTKKFWLITLCLTLILVMAACSGNNNNNGGHTTPAPANNGNTDNGADPAEGNGEEAELKHVNLKWYFLTYGLPTDMDLVEAEFNKITEELINATVDLVPVDAGDYGDKMNTIVAAGEEFDILWTSNWRFGYNDNVNKGAFLPIEDLLPEYAPNVLELFGDKLEDTRIEGSIYAIPNFQTFTHQPGFIVQKRFADKYNLDIANIKNYADLEPFLKQIRENEPDNIIPFGAYKDFSALPEAYGQAYKSGISHNLSDPFTVIYTQMDPKWDEHLEIMHRWFKAGYINQDAATVTDLKSLTSTGNVAVINDFTLKPGGEAVKAQEMGGNEVVYVPIAEPTFTGVQPTMNAISHTSKNPERAVMLLDLMASNAELFNLVKFGIEGKHYELNEKGKVVYIPDSGYNGVQGWVMGNETIGYLTADQPDNTWEMTIEQNNAAKKSALYGFSFNNESIKTEQAALTAVSGEFLPGLATGTLDPSVYLPQYREALKRAGVETYVAEQQRQLDEWAKAQGLK